MPAPPVPRTVQRLRSEIETIDRSIVLLLGARERAQHQLLAWKESSGIPGHDPGQEERVLARAIGWARETGADEQVVAEVIRLALDRGKGRFELARRRGRTRIPAADSRSSAAPGESSLLGRVNSG